MGTVKETWKPVVGYEGWYEISNYGNLRSVDRVINYSNGSKRFYKGLIYAKNHDTDGYVQYTLNRNSVKTCHKAHRLVALHFIPNDSKKPCINHKDGNIANNHVSNLEWCTVAENTQHAYDNNLIKIPRGEERPNSKLTADDVKAMRARHFSGESASHLAREYGVATSTAVSVIQRKKWKHI